MKFLLLSFLILSSVSSTLAQVTPGPPFQSTRLVIDSTSPAFTDTAGNSLLTDINAAYNEIEKSIEQAYAKLIRQQNDEKSKLEEKIKGMDEQIEKLKEQADKIRRLADKMEQIMAQLMAERKKSTESINKQKQQTLLELRKALAEKKPNTKSESQIIKLRIENAMKDSLRLIPLRVKPHIILAN